MGYNGFASVMCLMVLMPGSARTARILRELTGHKIPILFQISINGSVELLGILDFRRTSGTMYTDNILDTHDTTGWEAGITSNKNWGVQPGDLMEELQSRGMMPSLTVLITPPGVRRMSALLCAVSAMTIFEVSIVRTWGVPPQVETPYRIRE